jgi:hypothetical protein
MAIDMIEHNELGALAHSRIGGNTCFVDENHITPYRSFSSEEDFYNLFGSKKRKDSIQDVRNEQNARWSKYKVDTCANVQKLIDEIGIDIEKTTKLMASTNAFYLQPQLETAREWEAKAKTIQSQMDCINVLAAEKQASDRASVLDTLTNISDTTVAKAKNDLSGISSKDKGSLETVGGVNKNILIYGGIGIAGLIVLALFLKK